MKHTHKWKFDRNKVVIAWIGGKNDTEWACKCECGAKEYVKMRVEDFDEDDQNYLTT